MKDNSSDRFLDVLVGEKLSSVTFVMDYLQIDFDGNQFTFNIWPILTVGGIDYKFGDAFYRDKLCSLISKIVSQVIMVVHEKVIIAFDAANSIYLSLDPNNPEIITPEIGTFGDTTGNLYVF